MNNREIRGTIRNFTRKHFVRTYAVKQARRCFSVEIGAANGVGTARGLAKIFSLVIEHRLLNNAKLLESLHEPQNKGDCEVLTYYCSSDDSYKEKATNEFRI